MMYLDSLINLAMVIFPVLVSIFIQRTRLQLCCNVHCGEDLINAFGRSPCFYILVSLVLLLKEVYKYRLVLSVDYYSQSSSKDHLIYRPPGIKKLHFIGPPDNRTTFRWSLLWSLYTSFIYKLFSTILQNLLQLSFIELLVSYNCKHIKGRLILSRKPKTQCI